METLNPMQDQFTGISELNTRVRILEGKYNLTRDRMLLINQNMIDHYKSLTSEIRSINEELREIKENLETIKETSKDIVKEMAFFARKEQVKILEKYINMWNPLNFVTEEDVLELLKKKRGKKASGRK